MSSRDITFAVDNVTKVFRIKESDDLELSKGSGGIPHCEAYRCLHVVFLLNVFLILLFYIQARRKVLLLFSALPQVS